MTIIKNKRHSLLQPYQAALRHYLERGTPTRLKAALRLGSQAVTLKLETLDLALLHEQALMAQVLAASTPKAQERIIKKAKVFFAEAIIPIERTHRMAMEANIHLNRLNQGLSRRSLDLAESNRQLKKEVARRHVAEKTLRKSEQHTSQLLEHSRLLQSQMRRLSRGILSVQEEERKRISRELHDVIAQMLTGINVRLATLKTDATANTKDLAKSIAKTQRLVEKSVDIVHRFASELRPAVLDELGLIPALHTFCKSFIKRTGIRVRVAAFAGVEKLNSAKRTALYRVAHEALANVARHAHASQVDVTLHKFANSVCMDIRDNGIGFELKQVFFTTKYKRLGLLGIRERVEMLGGKFSIESSPGKGTTIHAQIPFKEHTRL